MNPGPAPAGAHPSRFAFFEYLAGEGTAAERRAVAAHAASCPDCAAALRDAVAERDAFAARHPSRRHLAALRRFPTGRDGTGLAGRLASLARSLRWPAIAAAAVLVLAAVALLMPPGSGRESDLSPKGAAAFILSVNGRVHAADTLACRPGDTLQLAIVSDRPVHYAILYRDDDGPLQAYLEGGHADPLGAPEGRNLPHAIVLDAGWKRELLHCLWSPEPFEPTAARDRVEGAPDGNLRLRTFVLVNGP